MHLEFAVLELCVVEGVVDERKQEGGGAFADFEVEAHDGCDVLPHAGQALLYRVYRCSQFMTY